MSERLATIYRAWPEIARRRSRRGALTSVFVLLSIGLIEPLACIIHCEIIELLVTPTASAAGVHHNHAHYTTAAKPNWWHTRRAVTARRDAATAGRAAAAFALLGRRSAPVTAATRQQA